MDLSVDFVKVVVLFSLLVMTFLVGMIPVLIINCVKKESKKNEDNFDFESTNEYTEAKLSRYKRGISFLNCLAAGVFLATCFLDLLPSVQHNLTRVLYDINVFTGFPVAEFVMCLGLFLILIIEQIVLTFKEGRPPPQTEQRPLLAPVDEQRDEMIESYHSDYSIHGISDQPRVPEEQGWTAPWAERNSGLLNSGEIQPNTEAAVNSHNINYERETHNRPYSRLTRHSQEHHSQQRKISKTESSLQIHSPLRTMLLLFALSLHSIFEGLTIGLQMSAGGVLGLFAALGLHKSILSFSLSMNLVQSKISVKSAIKSIIIFSVSSPLGIAIGILITDLWNSLTSELVHGLLQGIASGTFLYIIFFEILPKEFNSEADRLLKVLFLILGFSAVTGILFLDNDIKEPFCVIRDRNSP